MVITKDLQGSRGRDFTGFPVCASFGVSYQAHAATSRSGAVTCVCPSSEGLRRTASETVMKLMQSFGMYGCYSRVQVRDATQHR